MTFWLVEAVAIVVSFALAWWSSGRKRPGAPRPNFRRGDTGEADATLQAFKNRNEPPGGTNTLF